MYFYISFKPATCPKSKFKIKTAATRYLHISQYSKCEAQQTKINIYQFHRCCHYTYFVISFTEHIETSEGNQKSAVVTEIISV